MKKKTKKKELVARPQLLLLALYLYKKKDFKQWSKPLKMV